jgi:calpain family cysteine protease
VNKLFLIGAGTREYGHPDPYQRGRQGIEDGHAYSVLRAVSYRDERLLMIKNPWGKVEWTGPWSDGSKEWTAQALEDLDYKFGNEGIFWMPYSDFLERFVQVWRTRLFTPEWNVSQHWTTIQVPWSGASNPTIFEFTIKSPTPAVIALSQLDSRYYGGLVGQYSYDLAFRLHKYGNKEHIVRGYSSGDRSAVTEVDLKPGTYNVLMKVEAYRDSTQPLIEDVIEQNWLSRREKLIRTGRAYETAHAKSKVQATAAQRARDIKARTRNNAAKPKEHTSQVQAQDQPWTAPLVVGLKIFCQNTAANIKVRDLSRQRALTFRRRVWLDAD